MLRKKRGWRALLPAGALVLALSLLAGCGKDETPAPDEETAAAEATEAAKTSPPATLVVYTIADV